MDQSPAPDQFPPVNPQAPATAQTLTGAPAQVGATPLATPIAQQFCSNCQFLRFNTCRRHAPTPYHVVPPAGGLGVFWPAVLPKDWCGWWEPAQ